MIDVTFDVTSDLTFVDITRLPLPMPTAIHGQSIPPAVKVASVFCSRHINPLHLSTLLCTRCSKLHATRHFRRSIKVQIRLEYRFRSCLWCMLAFHNIFLLFVCHVVNLLFYPVFVPVSDSFLYLCFTCFRQFLYLCFTRFSQFLYLCFTRFRQFLYLCFTRFSQFLYRCFTRFRQFLYLCFTPFQPVFA